MKNKIIIAIVILAIICSAAGSLFYRKLAKQVPENSITTVGNTAGNLYNGGYFCEDDEYVYFSNPYDNYALYRMLPNETKMEKLLPTKTKMLNSAGKYLYYFQGGSGGDQTNGVGSLINMVGVYRIEKRNTKRNKCLELTRLDNMILAGNNLYYDTNDSENEIVFKETSLDGQTMQSLANYKITAACADGAKIFYNNTTSDYHLYALDLMTKRMYEVYPKDVYMPIVEGNELFYIDIHNNYALTKYNLTTGETVVLDNTRTDLYNLSTRYVYYQTAGDTPQLKRVARNGADQRVIADGAYNAIQITSQYVYFKNFNTDMPIFKTPLDGDLSVSTFDAASAAAQKK